MASTGDSADLIGELIEDAKLVESPDVDDRDWVLDGAIGLDEADRVGLKRRFCDLQENCLAKWRKVPDAVAEVLYLIEKLLSGIETGSSAVAEATDNGRTKKLEAEFEEAGARGAWRSRR